MSSLFVVRIAGVSALLAVVAQFAAIGTAIANGIRPGAPLDVSNGPQLLAAGDERWLARVDTRDGSCTATLAPGVRLAADDPVAITSPLPGNLV